MTAATRTGKISSGDEWLQMAPPGWTVVRMRFRAEVNPSRSEINGVSGNTQVSFVPMEAVGEYGGLRLNQRKLLEEVSTGYTYFREGDVIVAKITPCFENGKGSIARGLENGLGFGTTELHVLRPHAELDRCFLFYLTISHPFRDMGSAYMYGAGGQKRVPDDFVRNFRYPVPPIEEQRAIAAFLDQETAQIDALVEKKQRQIELLQEKRAALISHAVTRGLNPNVNMKDSGIEWLGEIPEHWKTLKFKRCAWFQEGPGLRNWQFSDHGVRVVCVTNITEAGIDFDDYQKFIDHDEYEAGYRRFTVKQGDLLLSSSGNSWGKVAEFCHNETAILNTSTIRINELTNPVLNRRMIKWSLQSHPLHEQLGLMMTGACQPNFGPSHLAEVIVAVLDLDEQDVIAAFLDRETARIDGLVTKVRESISMLREYRTALISGAVTGKIDVCEEVS